MGKKSNAAQPNLPGFGPPDEPAAPGVQLAAQLLAQTTREGAQPWVSSDAANESLAEECDAECDASGAPDLRDQTVYVIDANSLIFQVFHAIPEMTSPAGEPVNAVFGFTRDLLYLLQQKRPAYLFCAFDLPGPTFRHELYAEYKAHRAEMPEALTPQFPKLRAVIAALGLPILELPGYEADDILATLARLTEERGGECYLVSADKDCRQLIRERVKILNLRKNQILDAAALQAEWGVRPEQVVDYQALVGDSVDNVPGVPQIGPKAAQELLQRFGSLDAILAQVEQVSGAKRQENLRTHRAQALLSRRLVQLDRHVPLEIDWRAMRVGRANLAQLQALFTEYGFHRFAEQVRALQPVAAKTSPATDYRCVATPAELADFVAQLGRQPLISFDTETTSIAPTQAEIVGLSFAWQPGHAFYLPLRAPPGEQVLDAATTLESLRPILENPRIAKVGQNVKYDLLVLRSVGIQVQGVVFDTMLASYLLESGERNHSLDELAARLLNHTTIRISELIGTGKNQKRMDEVPLAQITPYACQDADLPLSLRTLLEPQLAAQELLPLWKDVELPLIDVLADMEATGIRVDVQRLRELSQRYDERLRETEREIYRLAGREFNIASTKQLQQVLFEELKLPPLKKGKTGASTDASVLEELAAQHPLPAAILQHRQYAKLKNTYVDALPELVHPRTGRVHASFHQAVAATGRLSSSDPNLQNIPIRTDVGREIRSAFLPGYPGWKLLAADYSQIELRVLAHLSGDAALRTAFAADEDIHAFVAAQVNNVAQPDVTADMRRQAKAVNFGVIYGQSAFGLAAALDITPEEADDFIEKYFARYPGVDCFMAATLAECRKLGYVRTMLGRRRAIRGIRPDAVRAKNLPERTAVNTVIQGSAADLIKLAMLAVHRRLKHERLAANLLLQIHDELVFEVSAEDASRLQELVVAEMSQAMSLSVPLKVDVSIGDDWSQT